ncbi:MAG TPA: FkbM family methyltransferase [Chitinophagaceae bacterium]
MQLLKSVYYRILDLVTLGRGVNVAVNNFNLRFPPRYYKFFSKHFEKENFSFLEKRIKTGDVIIDVGAHMGVFAVRCAQLTGKEGRVYAFEPTPSTFKVLRKIIKLNRAEENIMAVQAAVADQRGKTNFYMGDAVGDFANSLVNYDDSKHKGYEVNIISIDEFMTENGFGVDFLKIDAEGAELSVLRGAIKTVASQKPFCILSMHPESIRRFGHTNKQIWEFIQTHQYDVIHENKLMGENEFCSKEEMFDVHLLPRMQNSAG